MYYIGVLTNTHGLKGDVTIKPRTDFEERFARGSVMQLCDNNQNFVMNLTVEKSSYRKGMYYVKFKEFDHINDVEKYKGFNLMVNQEQLYELDDDEFYTFDLKGLNVYCDQQLIGNVTGVKSTGAHDILEIINSDQKRILIPFIKEFVLKVDIENEKIEVKYIEGLW